MNLGTAIRALWNSRERGYGDEDTKSALFEMQDILSSEGWYAAKDVAELSEQIRAENMYFAETDSELRELAERKLGMVTEHE